jgi:hypothetical membrane protein
MRVRNLSRVLGAIAVPVLTAALYSNWILLPVFHGSAPEHNFVSELGARNVPHAAVFNSLTIVAGVMITVLALGWRKQFATRHEVSLHGLIAAAALLVVGVGNVIDGILPMDCSPSMSAQCEIAENAWHVSWQDWGHTIESVVTNVALVAAMAFFALALERIDGLRWLGRATIPVVVVVGILLVAQVIGVLGHDAIAANERWTMAITSIWFACLGLANSPRLTRRKTERADAYD